MRMAYNPVDGMMYFLCQDSQYNMNLKRIDMTSFSEVEDLGNLATRLWTLAIDNQGTAYGIFNYGAFTDNDYRVYTIDYQVTNPVGIAEQTMDDLEGQTVSIYDLTGRLVFQGCYNGHRCFEGLKPGIYVINTAGHLLKVMIK